MQKYLTVFSVSWENEFVYRLNFLLWRFRNVLRFLMTFFLWNGIFVSNTQVFGYTQPKMLTYVFLVLLVQTMVLSAPSSDSIGGEIASGDLSNYLVKPISYLKYWFVRDLASKQLNIIFATGEIVILFLVFRPVLQVPQLIPVLGSLGGIGLAVGIYYLLSAVARFLSFWTPENTWGVSFVILVLVEILAGGIFPLDILPKAVSLAIQFTPFPYLVYFPIAIFVGQIQGWEVIRILIQSAVWLLIMVYITKYVWHRGLLVYSSEGR